MGVDLRRRGAAYGLGVQLRSGLYGVAPRHATRGTGAPTLDVVTYTQFVMTRPWAIDRIGIEVTALAAGGTERVGIYADGGDVPVGAPLLETGDLDAHTANALVVATVAFAQPPGVYWHAVLPHTLAATLRTVGAPVDCIAESAANAVGSQVRASLTQSAQAGALPNGPVPDNVTTVAPIVFMRGI